MKKNLLATTALVAAGALAAQGALAEDPIKISVGGYNEHWVGVGSTDMGAGNEVTDLDVQEDSEIHFTGRTTLDNGLSFGVNIQLEGQNQGDMIDESYVFVRGDFGEILLGDENGAAYAMVYGPVSHGTGLESGDVCNWAAGGCSFELHTTNGNFARRDNDSTKIRYISPRFSGFQVGASYAPEATQDDDGFPSEASNNGVNEEGVVALAANYDQKFGDTRVQIGLGYQKFTDANGTSVNDAYAAGIGARIGFGGFTVSGAYNMQNERNNAVDTRSTMGGSVAYAEGPIGVSLGVIYGQDEGKNSPGVNNDDEQISVELGGKYVLGPGVEARGSVFYWSRDDASAASTADGYSVVGGIRLVF